MQLLKTVSLVGSRCRSSSGSWKMNCRSWIAVGSGMTLCGVLTVRVAGRLTTPSSAEWKSSGLNGIKNLYYKTKNVSYSLISTSFLRFHILVSPAKRFHLTTYIIGDVVIKLLRDEVIQTHNLYAILIPY